MGRIVKYSEPIPFHKAMPGSTSIVIMKRDEPAVASTAKPKNPTSVTRKADTAMTDYYDTSRDPWHAMLDRQARARQAITGESYAKSFTECYTDPSNASIVAQSKYEDLAKSMDAMYGSRLSFQKAAPTPAYDPLRKHAELAEIRGPAHAKLHSLAIDHQRAHPGMSYQSAYGYLYAKPENVGLRNAIKAEHMSTTMSAHGELGKAAAPMDAEQDDVTPGSARAELHALTAARMRRDPTLSYERAFTQEYLHEDNRKLKQRVDEESILHAQGLSPAPAFPRYTSPGHDRDPSNVGRSGIKPRGYAGG
jgi:hypothetical protein